MADQLILALGREFGSGGHEIANLLAERFGLIVYERNMLDHIAQEYGMNAELLKKYDELPKRWGLYRTVNGFNNAPEDGIARIQFRYLREKAEAGESFVVVGRCAEEIFRENPAMISIFVRADLDFKLQRTMAKTDISEEEAMELIIRKDKFRKNYHDQYCKEKWGRAKNYDLVINSAKLGVAKTADLLEQYIRARMEARA